MLLMSALPALRPQMLAVPVAPQGYLGLVASKPVVVPPAVSPLAYLQVKTLEEACFADVPGEHPNATRFFHDLGRELLALEQGRRFKA